MNDPKFYTEQFRRSLDRLRRRAARHGLAIREVQSTHCNPLIEVGGRLIYIGLDGAFVHNTKERGPHGANAAWCAWMDGAARFRRRLFETKQKADYWEKSAFRDRYMHNAAHCRRIAAE